MEVVVTVIVVIIIVAIVQSRRHNKKVLLKSGSKLPPAPASRRVQPQDLSDANLFLAIAQKAFKLGQRQAKNKTDVVSGGQLRLLSNEISKRFLESDECQAILKNLISRSYNLGKQSMDPRIDIADLSKVLFRFANEAYEILK